MRTHSVLFVVVCALGTRAAQAAPIPYGDVSQGGVVRQRIMEDPSPAPNTFYGVPGMGGDSLVFGSLWPGANGAGSMCGLCTAAKVSATNRSSSK